MTSVVDLAKLSEAAYNDTLKVGQWLRYGLPYTEPGSGYKSALFQHTETKEFVTAIAGTSFTDGDDWKSNRQIFLGQMPEQYRVARSAYGFHRGRVGLFGLYLTGHSLGGGLASMLAKEHGDPVVTFNAPGVARAFASLKETEPGVSSVRDDERKVLHICSYFDIVHRGTGAHMGEPGSLERISTRTPITGASAGALLLGAATSVIGGAVAAVVGVVAAGIGVWEGHSITSLVRAIERKPRYQQDLAWL